MQNYYKLLGISTSATFEEVKKAYFEMAKKYHPDLCDKMEVKKFHDVAEAYRVLSDKNAKQAYDTTIVNIGVVKQPKVPTYKAVKIKNRAHYRDDELKTYHRNRFKRAIFRLVGLTFVVGLLAYVVAVILGGKGLYGGVSGLLIGFGFSVNKNFNISSFFISDNRYKVFKIFTWLLFFVGFVYFVWLIVKDLVSI